MERDLRVEPGALLAAWPDLRDPNFMHRVVVMCQHGAAGAFGLVTNQISGYTTRDLLSEHPVLGRVPFPVHLGGPVDHSRVEFLHTVPDEIPSGECLDGKLWFGGELEALARYVAKDQASAERRVRIFVGYSGWDAGQLDTEIAVGSWIVAPADLESVFGEEGEETWRRVVRSVGREGRDLLNHPPDVSWN